ncbi:MAG: 6-phosphofructokinase [Nanoarchaeota archaeon]
MSVVEPSIPSENPSRKNPTRKAMASPKIGVLTGGGDCPGLNNVIKLLVNESGRFKMEGITEGLKGAILMAIDPSVKTVSTYTLPMDNDLVSGKDRQGGTMLMSSRANPLNYEGNDVSDAVVDFLNKRYHAVIAIGGEDTLGAAGRLAEKGLRVIGVPKTIDKDLCGTQFSLGYDSALNSISNDLENLISTAGSHGRTYFVEVMGRKAGHLAYWGGHAANAHFITIPEVETDMDMLFQLIRERKEKLKMERGYTLKSGRYTIAVISEGTRLKWKGQETAVEILKGKKDPYGNVSLGGVADFLEEEYLKRTGHESRSLKLGHLQRGGKPSFHDRILGVRLGHRALELLKADQFGRMVTFNEGIFGDVSLDTVIGRIRIIDAQKCYDAANFRPVITGDRMYHEKEVPK